MYTHPYSDPRYPEEPPKPSYQETPSHKTHKKFSYILSISKKHIFFFILVMFLIFSLIFISGITAGYSIGKNENPQDSQTPTSVENTALDNYNNFDPSVLSDGTSNSLEDNGTFVSEQVTLGSDFQDGDVLKVGPGNSAVAIQSLESSKKQEKKKKAQKASSTASSPSPGQANGGSRGKPPKTKTANKKVTTPKKYVDDPEPGVTYYYIQVIATVNVDRAKKVYDQLQEKKYPVKVKKSAKDGLYMYAIRVGLYTDKRSAQRHLRLIRKGGGYTQAFMKSYRVEKSSNATISKTSAPLNLVRENPVREKKEKREMSALQDSNPVSGGLGNFKALPPLSEIQDKITTLKENTIDYPQSTSIPFVSQ